MKQLFTTVVLMAAVAGGNAVAQSTSFHSAQQLAGMEAKAHSVGHSAPAAMRGSAPANDECTGAVAMTVGSTCTAVSGTADGATQSMDPITCNNYTADNSMDVWYSFVATGPYSEVTVTGGGDETTGFDVVLEVFSGSCGSLTSIGCSDATLRAGVESVNAATTAGSTYYYRVYYWPYSDPQTVFDFTSCVVGGAAPPANDDCSGATAHNLAVGGSVDMSGDNTGATDGEGFGFNSAWESFTISSCAMVTIDFCGTSPSFPTASIVAQLGNSCPVSAAVNASSAAACGDGANAIITYNFLPAGTYYIPVLQGPGSTGPYHIHVAAAACPAPPANDECTGAITLVSNTNCMETYGTTFGATQSMDAILCNGFTGTADDDVWYSFVATNTDQTISVQGQAGFDAVIELFSGTCSNLTSIACGDATFPPTGVEDTGDSLSYSGLTVGSTYYFRVYDFNANTATPTYAVCVQEGLNSSLGVNELVADNSVNVYPNPSNGDITIAYNAATGNVGVQVLDMTGRLVYNVQRTMTKGQNVFLPLAGKLAVGQYLLRLDTPEGRKEQRIAVK